MTIPGQGGQPSRPQNAPPPGTVAYGIQPGSTGVLVGHIVLVFGPANSVVGVFVYAPGTTPGRGNPPIASMTNSSTDPFGNPVQPSIAAYGPTVAGGVSPETIFMDVVANALGLFFYTGAATDKFPGGHYFATVANPGTSSEQINFSVVGPTSTASAGRVDVQQLSDGASSPAIATGFLIYNDTSNSQHQTAFWGQHGFTGAIVQTLTGAQPGTINTTLAAETWHTMSGFGAGWSAGTPTPQYRFEPIGPSGQVRLRGQVLSTAAEAANSAIFTLPAGYHPSVAATFLTPSTTGTLTAGSVAVTTGGVIQQNTATAGAGAVIFLDGVTFPLD